MTKPPGDLSASQRLAQERLDFMESLFEAIPGPVFVVSADGLYRSVNRAWENFFGIRREQIIGTSGAALQAAHPLLQAVAGELQRDTAGAPAARTIEIDLTRTPADPRKLHMARATYADSEHAVAGTIGMITDLTALAEAEQRVQAALVEKAAAEAANEAKTRFIANMSHEICTPLTAIIGYAESLLDSNQDMEERIAGIRTIIRAGQHLHQIINDILDLSKIEAGRLELECIPVNVVELCREVATLAQGRADEKGLQFRLEYEFPLPAKICSDPLRLRQILINLTGNAVKFTDHGSVTMRVRCDRTLEQIVVSIHDTGIGMTPGEAKRLFTPFMQADASTTRRYGGTGLGLYLSHQFAQRLGGDIRVESVPGTGSVFTLTVAARGLAKTDWLERDTPAAATVEAGPSPVAEKLGGEVLVVEDNDDNRQLITLHLRKFGIEPHYAENGAVAVALALEHPYALILMDMQMPVMDGLEATARLRAAGYSAPIVALTANASKQDEQKCRAAGCNGFVPKPIDREALFRELRHYLRAGQPAEDTDAAPLVSALYEEEPGLAGLVEKFVVRFPEMLAEMEAARARADWAALKGQAHNLKGVGGGYGYPQVSKVAAQLEFAAASADADGVTAWLTELRQLALRIDRGMQGAVTAPRRQGAG
jgi:PAS domain S-box-containing protein